VTAITGDADREDPVTAPAGFLAKGRVHGVGAAVIRSDWTYSPNRGTTDRTASACWSPRSSRGSGGSVRPSPSVCSDYAISVHHATDEEGVDGMENRTGRGCVQRRLARSVGDRPTEAKVRRLVAWVAGRKEIEFLKPTDKAIQGMVSESSGRNNRERKVTSKWRNPRGRAYTRWAKAA
jgi:hypothetical protein